MIQGKTKEQEYREKLIDSSSSLKIFSQDRRKYFKLFVEGIKETSEEESTASIIGRVTDTLLLEPNEFDNRFYLSSITKPITGKMGDFVNALVDITIQNTDEEGNICKSFEEIATEARAIAQFDWKLPVILDKFVGKDPEILYKELRQVKSKGLTVITLQEVQNAEKIVEELKTNEITASIVNLVDSDNYSVYNQLQIEGYEIDGLLLKSMIDKVVVNHKKKTIEPFDLKVIWALEEFYSEYYLYRRAYIQALLYKKAIEFYFKDLIENGYKVSNLAFIVADSINYYSPIIYTLSNEDMNDAYNGFEYKSRYYPGVKDIIENLKFAKENNLWRISKKNFEKGGIINIKD